MDCKTVLEKINAYLDGELPRDVTESVERHLSMCHGCEGELQSLKALNRVLDRGTEMPLPPNFARETLRKAVSLKKGALTLSEWWGSLTHLWRFAACAAAIAGLLTGGLVPQSLHFHVEDPGTLYQAFLDEDEVSLTKTYMKLARLSESAKDKEEQ